MRIHRKFLLTSFLVVVFITAGANAVVLAEDTIDGVTYTLTSPTADSELITSDDPTAKYQRIDYSLIHHIATGVPDINGRYPVLVEFTEQDDNEGDYNRNSYVNWKFSDDNVWDESNAVEIEEVLDSSATGGSGYTGTLTTDWEGGIYLCAPLVYTASGEGELNGYYVGAVTLDENDGLELSSNLPLAFDSIRFWTFYDVWGMRLNCSRDGSRLSLATHEVLFPFGKMCDSAWVTFADYTSGDIKWRDPIMAAGNSVINNNRFPAIGAIGNDGKGYFKTFSGNTLYPADAWSFLSYSMVGLQPVFKPHRYVFSHGDEDNWDYFIVPDMRDTFDAYGGQGYAIAPYPDKSGDIFGFDVAMEQVYHAGKTATLTLYRWGENNPTAPHIFEDTLGDPNFLPTPNKRPGWLMARPQIDFYEHGEASDTEYKEFIVISFKAAFDNGSFQLMRIFLRDGDTLIELFDGDEEFLYFADTVYDSEAPLQRFGNIAISKNNGNGSSGSFDIHCLWNENDDNPGEPNKDRMCNPPDEEPSYVLYREFNLSFEPAP